MSEPKCVISPSAKKNEIIFLLPVHDFGDNLRWNERETIAEEVMEKWNSFY